MRVFFRCVFLFFLIWIFWHAIIMLSGGAMNVETINESFLRMLHNFTSFNLVKDILVFLMLQWGLLLALSWIAFLSARGFQYIFNLSDWKVIFCSVFSLALMIHILNSLLFPISSTAFPIDEYWAYPLIGIVTIALLAFALLACLRQYRLLIPTVVLLTLALLPYWSDFSSGIKVKGEVNRSHIKPDILVIGIDALRPQELAYFGGQHDIMPFLDKLLQKAEVYSSNYTPAARTHAAWVALLSGRYPYHNGVRFNLTEDELIDKERLLTHTLKQQGYRTVWGLDERRFNNIDESYGFDVAIGPKVGAADFLITKFSDNPLVNLLSNTQLGAKLFPYIYQNRANFITYIPYRFNDELIKGMRGDQPVFLGAHLTLPHYPFINHLMKRVEIDSEEITYYRNYMSMLDLADRQLANLFDKLADAGFLNNTIVYLISDHGEGFPNVDSGLEKGNPYSSFKVDSYGHGTNVMTLSQYHTLLARVQFRNGEVVNQAKREDKLTSLIDIAPDIISQLGIRNNYTFDGIPFDRMDSSRYIILESSYSNDAVSASRINQLQVLQQSAEAYYVAKDGRLLLQRELYHGFNRAKQRAIIGSDGIMVALFPDEKGNVFVVDIPNNTWWPSTPYVPLDSAVWHKRLEELCQFYKDDESFEQDELCQLAKSNSSGLAELDLQ